MPDGQPKMPCCWHQSVPGTARFWSAALLRRFVTRTMEQEHLPRRRYAPRGSARARFVLPGIFRRIPTNPKGIASSSPGLPSSRGYPGCGAVISFNPNGVASSSWAGRNPVGVDPFSTRFSQGSSQLATLGFKPESLWDSFRRRLQVVGNAKRALPQSRTLVRFPEFLSAHCLDQIQP